MVEETSTGTTASFSTLSAFGPDGLRERYTVPTGSETAFFYDPQGSTVQTGTSLEAGTSQYALSVFVEDGFGALRGSWSSSGVSPAPHKDPSGFGGEFGYYTDVSTGRRC